MKVLKTLLALTVFGFLFISVKAQNQGQKNLVYEFTVTGMKSETDAAKLDSVMLTKKGVYKSKTDFKTGKIKVTCAYFFDFDTIKAPLILLGFETPDKNIIGKPEETSTE